MDVKWTTEKPTEPGWYFVYGVCFRFSWKTKEEQPDEVDLVELTRSEYKTKDGDKELYIHEGTNGRNTVSACDYTHWMKVEMPVAP